MLCLGLFAMFSYSKLGIAMQASSQNQLAAYYMGIPVKRLNGLVWGLAAWRGGDRGPAAGAHHLRARQHGLHRPEGLSGGGWWAVSPACPGAIVGGLIIGIVEALSGFYLPEGFKDIAPYIVVLIMLVLKPNGLFGEKLRKKV